jgi:3-isopropylmalate dehydratase small subunit
MRAIRKSHAQPVIETVDTDSVLPDAFVSRMYDEQESDDAMSAMRMLAYALASLALTGAAVALAVFITIFNQP